MIGAEVTNAGFSGYSASDWYAKKMALYPYKNFDTFIVWLGTNNGLNQKPKADSKSEEYYYRQIIKRIKEENPSSVVVLCTIFASKGDVRKTNSIIRQIAKEKKLFVIDMSDLDSKTHPELHAGINNPHFGKAGNVYIANRIVENLGKYIAESPLRSEVHYTKREN